MLEYLPQELRDNFEAARMRKFKRASKLRLALGEAAYPVLRYWQNGLSLDAQFSPKRLRGLVDLYDGPRHIFQCLIVASELDGNELICDFKRATPVAQRAALDYWRDENAPIAYLPKV